MMSADLDFYKDRLVWEKPKATGHQLLRHMQAHEDILIFSKGTIVRHSKRTMTFNPQGIIEKIAKRRKHAMSHVNAKPRKGWADSLYVQQGNYPRSVLRYAKDADAIGLHPFAKPVALLEYLIRTYSNECAGARPHHGERIDDRGSDQDGSLLDWCGEWDRQQRSMHLFDCLKADRGRYASGKHQLRQPSLQ